MFGPEPVEEHHVTPSHGQHEAVAAETGVAALDVLRRAKHHHLHVEERRPAGRSTAQPVVLRGLPRRQLELPGESGRRFELDVVDDRRAAKGFLSAAFNKAEISLSRWNGDVAGHIRNADANWPSVLAR